MGAENDRRPARIGRPTGLTGLILPDFSQGEAQLIASFCPESFRVLEASAENENPEGAGRRAKIGLPCRKRNRVVVECFSAGRPGESDQQAAGEIYHSENGGRMVLCFRERDGRVLRLTAQSKACRPRRGKRRPKSRLGRDFLGKRQGAGPEHFSRAALRRLIGSVSVSSCGTDRWLVRRNSGCFEDQKRGLSSGHLQRCRRIIVVAGRFGKPPGERISAESCRHWDGCGPCPCRRTHRAAVR